MAATPSSASSPKKNKATKSPMKSTLQKAQKLGRGRDTILAHITPEEAALLKARGGAGTINPRTGLLEFEEDGETLTGENDYTYSGSADDSDSDFSFSEAITEGVSDFGDYIVESFGGDVDEARAQAEADRAAQAEQSGSTSSSSSSNTGTSSGLTFEQQMALEDKKLETAERLAEIEKQKEADKLQAQIDKQEAAGTVAGVNVDQKAVDILNDPEVFLTQQGGLLSGNIPTVDANAEGTTIGDVTMDTGALAVEATQGTVTKAADAAQGTTVTADETAQGTVTEAGQAIRGVTSTTGPAVQGVAATTGPTAQGSAATATGAQQGATSTYTAVDPTAQVAAAAAEAQQAEVRRQALVDAESALVDMQGVATGRNKDGSINETGIALTKYANLDTANVIDTSTLAGKEIARQLGEGNYVDYKSTVQGQLDILSKAFVDANGNPKIPSFASGVARNVSRIAAFKGVTGTAATAAMSTAIMESMLPVAQADSKLFQTIQLTNLSNKQQQTINTANVLAKFELTNQDARMTAAITNAKTFMQYDMANLANRQQVEVLNTQNRVQSILETAKEQNVARRFASQSQNDMDMFYDNLGAQISQFNSAQKNAMTQFNAGEANDASQFNAAQQNLMDQFNAAEINAINQFNAAQQNAMSQFNAAEINAINQFNAGLKTEMSQFNASEQNAIRQFNAAQQNAMSQFNAGEVNAINQFNAAQTNAMTQFNVGEVNSTAQFNSTLENNREQFYKEMQFQIDASNAEWRRTVTLAETEMEFEAAALDVKNIVNISTETLNQLWDRADAQLDYIWKSSENALDRETDIELAKLGAAANRYAAQQARNAANSETMGLIIATAMKAFI